MKDEQSCPLPRKYLDIIQLAVDTEDDRDDHLATLTPYAPGSLKTFWRDIEQELGVHSRGPAQVMCIRKGWVKLDPRGGAD